MRIGIFFLLVALSMPVAKADGFVVRAAPVPVGVPNTKDSFSGVFGGFRTNKEGALLISVGVRDYSIATTAKVLKNGYPARLVDAEIGDFIGGTFDFKNGDVIEYVSFTTPRVERPVTKEEAARHKAEMDANALRYHQMLAEKGDAYGELQMGLRYAKADGVTYNPTLAREYFHKAAVQGNDSAKAQLELLDKKSLNTNRFADVQTLLVLVSRQPWAKDIEQIPATVVDAGFLKWVPYASFRAGPDYEINVYGDPADPAGIEVGVYRGLLTNAVAKDNCIKVMSAALPQSDDRQTISKLKLEKDRQDVEGLTFEITPPTDPDAYGGWWVSVYDEKKINKSRATEEEIKRISVAKSALTNGTNSSGWSGADLSKSRRYHQMPEYHSSSPAYNASYTTASSDSTYSGSSYSGGRGDGSVYVHGYYRANGTYVNSYTRSSPHRR